MAYMEELKNLFRKHTPPLTAAEVQKMTLECAKILEREKQRERKQCRRNGGGDISDV
ncbi:MAG: hypothetical protein NWF05_05460 [Candidatus Bathyarchaeota archaeon]|nr:hypothetical protein [Candidatus Bathyarchaeota archaeon]